MANNKVMPVPDTNITKYWCMLRKSGLTYKEIAINSYTWLRNQGLSHAEYMALDLKYYAAVVRRHVNKELTKDGTGSSAI